MKINTHTIQHLLLITGMLFCFACADTEKKEVKVKAIKIEKNPFRFYKNIEVRPGLNFEFISWGKGVDSIGGYQILMSDSVHSNYKSIGVERKGVVTDVWNMDLDNDGNPEFYIELLSKKNMHHLSVFEYFGGNFNKINFPSLKSNQKKGYYSGNDKYIIKNGDLLMSFPITDPSDSTKKITKTYQYKLSRNSFSTSEVKTE